MKRVLFPLIFLLLVSCTTMTDNVVQTIDEESFRKLEEVYLNLTEYRINNNEEALGRAYEEITALRNEEIYNNDYRGKVMGLYALTQYYRNFHINARSELSDLEELTRDEELLWVTRALLEEEKENRLKILEEGYETVYNRDFLIPFLADALLENRQYGRATALYDEILLTAPEEYKEYYEHKRNLAWELLENPVEHNTDIVAEKELKTSQVIRFIAEETTLLSGITDSSLSDKALLKELMEMGFFYNKTIERGDLLLRRDLAYLLFALLLYHEGELDALEKSYAYSDYEKAEMEGKSPVPDVPLYEYYYEAVIFLVENEIMELPDGEHFFPSGTINGMTYANIVNNMNELYNY